MMPEKRLIDANELLEKLSERYLATDPGDPEQLGYLNARIIVRNQPTSDAVPVVRCRDCRYSVNIFKGYFLGCDMWKQSTPEDGFCHMGEKMDGGQYENQSV